MACLVHIEGESDPRVAASADQRVTRTSNDEIDVNRCDPPRVFHTFDDVKTFVRD